MKSGQIFALILAVFMGTTAVAAPVKFSCNAQVMTAPGQPATDCTVTVDPNDQTPPTYGAPGSISQDVYAGTLNLQCVGKYAASSNGLYGLYKQRNLDASDIKNYSEYVSQPFVTSTFKPLNFDINAAVAGEQFAGGHSVQVFFISEMKDQSGKIIGHTISSTLGLMMGCN